MPSSKPKLTLYIDQEDLDFLKNWAEQEDRSLNRHVLRLIHLAMNDLKNPNIKNKTIPTDDLDQIQKFIALLMGEHDRNGISFVLLGQALGIDPEKLHELHLLVQQCRQERIKQ